MSTRLTRIDFPEVLLGFVAPVGVDLRPSLKHFRAAFERLGYKVIPIKVTEVFSALTTQVPPREELVTHPPHRRLESYIRYGNQLREYFEDDQLLAALTIVRIVEERLRHKGNEAASSPSGNAFLLYQFKRREEIELLRSIYGRLFFQVSIYSRTGARVEYLAETFARAESRGTNDAFRPKAEEVVLTDQNEAGNLHGQRVSSIFHNADLILNSDSNDDGLEDQVYRFVNLLFGSNKISPSRDEYGMFVAKSAALRTLDLSRQVGAAIFSPDGEVISMGSNEVPKAGGGTYWSDERRFDDRDYVREHDSNDRRKREILVELLKGAGVDATEALKNSAVTESQFMDALEYGRIIHAEMSAICDAARLGRAIAGSTLFSTTFPCHMCAKHIVAAGISRVVFLEPYPKSLTAALHGDAVCIESSDRGRHQHYPAVDFTHFHGISHRRYRELFERSKRKDADGKFQEWTGAIKIRDGKVVDSNEDGDIVPRPLIDLKFPFYLRLETAIVEAYSLVLDEDALKKIRELPPQINQ